MSKRNKRLTDIEMIDNIINICKTAIDRQGLDDLKELEAMISEDNANFLLIENEDTLDLDLELLLQDTDLLEVNHQYYPKPKTKPLLTDWYI